MKLSSHAKVLLDSLQPNKHGRIRERLWSQTIATYAVTFLFGFIFLLLLSIPAAKQVSDSIGEKIDSLAVAEFNVTLRTTDPIVLAKHPKIVLDTSSNSSSEGFLVFGKNSYLIKKYYFFGEKKVAYDHDSNLKTADGTMRELFELLVWLILPGFILLLGFLILVSSLLFATIFAFIAKLFAKKISFRDLFVVSIHTQLVPLLLFMISLPLYSLFLPLLIFYGIIFSFGVILLNGYEFKSSRYND